MEIEENIKDKAEFDFCLFCRESGDNTNLYKIKNTKEYICFSCKEKYENAKETIKEFQIYLYKQKVV